MKFFAEDFTKPIIQQRGFRKVLEIGASFGNNTKMLLSNDTVELTIIDPCLDLDLAAEFGDRVKLQKGLSLEVLPKLTEPFDCIFVDGDHNWYTVINELKLIENNRLLSEDGVMFVHDVAWPYGRRDMYYQPETVPIEFQQPKEKKGIERRHTMLVESGGFNEGHWNAIQEGGPRNGVLTAVEDFIKQSPHQYYLVVDDRQWGLGILFRKSAKDAARLARELRSQIFRIRHVDPKLRAWHELVLRIKMSRIAGRLRRVRDGILRR